jgi:hypothetical protein
MSDDTKMWSVSLPFTGFLIISLEGEEPSSEEDAYARAIAAMDLDKARFQVKGTSGLVELGELETHQRIVRGNVCSAVLNEIGWEAG